MKEEIVQEILQHLTLSPAQLVQVKDAVRIVLCKYDITAKETSLQAINNSSLHYLNLYLASCEQSGKSPDTIKQYKYHLTRLLSYLNKDVGQITDDDLYMYMYRYRHERPVSAGYLNLLRLIFNGFFKWLVKKRKIMLNPVDGIDAIKTKQTIKKPINPTEMEQLRSTCKRERDLAIIECLYSSALRVSELLQLNRSDISFADDDIIVLGKGNKERVTYLNARAHVHLQRYLASRTDNDPALFVSIKAPHRRLTRNGLEEIVRNIGRHAEVSNVHPHRFRRTSAIDLLNVGMPIEQVQELLGHKSIETTRRYCTVTREAVKHNHKKYMSIA